MGGDVQFWQKMHIEKFKRLTLPHMFIRFTLTKTHFYLGIKSEGEK